MTARAEGSSTSALDRGDHQAAASEWVAAVSSWEAALATPDRRRAEARLQWFLDASATLTNSGHRRRQSNPIVVSAGAAVFGTILVLAAQEIDNAWRDVFAVIAWVLFVVAAGSGVLYAYQHRPMSHKPLTSSSISRAHELAEQMDAASATMRTGPRLRA